MPKCISALGLPARSVWPEARSGGHAPETVGHPAQPPPPLGRAARSDGRAANAPEASRRAPPVRRQYCRTCCWPTQSTAPASPYSSSFSTSSSPPPSLSTAAPRRPRRSAAPPRPTIPPPPALPRRPRAAAARCAGAGPGRAGGAGRPRTRGMADALKVRRTLGAARPRLRAAGPGASSGADGDACVRAGEGERRVRGRQP